MFTATFTAAKIQKQPMCSSVDDEWVKMCIYNEILLTHEKEGNSAICDNTGRPRVLYAT